MRPHLTTNTEPFSAGKLFGEQKDNEAAETPSETAESEIQRPDVLDKIKMKSVDDESLSFVLTFGESNVQVEASLWSKAVQEGIATKLSISPNAVSIDKVQTDDVRMVTFSLTAPALYVAGLLPPAPGSKQEEGESVKVKLSTLKKMTAKTSEKVKQSRADLDTLRAMLAEHDERAGNVDHEHSRNDMVEGIQALETTLKHAEEELKHYQDVLKKASQTPAQKQSEDVKQKLGDANSRLDEAVSTTAEKIGQTQAIGALIEAGGLAAFCEGKRAAQNNSLFTKVVLVSAGTSNPRGRRGPRKNAAVVSV